jgi:hypothetical protein
MIQQFGASPYIFSVFVDYTTNFYIGINDVIQSLGNIFDERDPTEVVVQEMTRDIFGCKHPMFKVTAHPLIYIVEGLELLHDVSYLFNTSTSRS